MGQAQQRPVIVIKRPHPEPFIDPTKMVTCNKYYDQAYPAARIDYDVLGNPRYQNASRPCSCRSYGYY